MEELLLHTFLTKTLSAMKKRVPKCVKETRLFQYLVYSVKNVVFIIILFRYTLNPKHLTGHGSLMEVVAKLHKINWTKYPAAKLSNKFFITRMMIEHRNYEYERRLLTSKPELKENPDNLPIEHYCALFFRDQNVALSLASELKLDKAVFQKIHDLASQGYYFNLTPATPLEAPIIADINLFYAYRNLALKTYHSGEGHLIPTVTHNLGLVQKRLLPSLPKPSKPLKKLLDQLQIELPEVKLLSPDWSALIGHNGHLNVHLMMRKMGWWTGSPLLLAYKDRIANQPFLSLFDELCPTLTLGENISTPLWCELASLTPFLGVSHQLFQFEDGRAMYWNDAGSMALQEWENQDRGFPLRDIYDKRYNTDETQQKFSSLLKKWGLQTSDWYVCLHMRDGQTRGEKEGAGESIRNTAIENYMDAIQFITGQGGWVIRMGSNKAPKLPAMPHVIDYAHSADQAPLMDLHLVRKARLFIGTTSGFAYVASSFGIPTAMVNAISSIGLLWSKDTRFALKPIQTREGRLLSQREVISEKWRWAYPTHESLSQAGLSVRENTPDEILETVKEVLAITSNTCTSSPLLKTWQACLPLPAFYASALPSSYFLEKYADSFLI